MACPKPEAELLRVEHSPAELRAWAEARRRAGARIGLVPTMGALHEGHLALVRALKPRVDCIAVSIFVNPTQFGPNEDYASYPRREAEDLAKLAPLGIDVVYMPNATAMYPAGFSTGVMVTGPLTEVLEGKIRPGHFGGVATVVAKLLLQAAPDIAAFGEKDYQQLQVVRRLVRDLGIPTEILPVPTMRDSEGLALSSRNAYLSPAELRVARQLNKILDRTAGRLRGGETAEAAARGAEEELKRAGFDGVDYVALADGETLAPMERLDRNARLLAAARIGRTRLIDNIPVTMES